MVADFLKRLKDSYERQIFTCREQIAQINTGMLENEKFLSLLESESRKVFRDFTPRELDNRNLKKIEELKQNQENYIRRKESIEEQMQGFEHLLQEVRQAMDEVKELEMTARDSKWFEDNIYNSGNADDDPTVAASSKMTPETAAKVEEILSYLLADPMRAKVELQNLL